jgi:hypothetical protein
MTGPYVIGERIRILREVDWLSFFEATRDGLPCLLVRLHTRDNVCADSFDNDVSAMRLLHHQAWLAPRSHGRLEGVPYVELEAVGGPTLATLFVGQSGIRAITALPIVRSLATLLDELERDAAPGAPAAHVASDTLLLGADRLRLVPPFRAIMRDYGPSHSGSADADEAWSSDTMLREPDRIFDLGLLLTMLVCGLTSRARVPVFPLRPDPKIIQCTRAALDGPNPEAQLIAPLVRRCLPDASDRFADLPSFIRALG